MQLLNFLKIKLQSKDPEAGLIRRWRDDKRKVVAQGISMIATGNMPTEGQFSITITDNGEGQTPAMMPDTLLSLAKSNKVKMVMALSGYPKAPHSPNAQILLAGIFSGDRAGKRRSNPIPLCLSLWPGPVHRSPIHVRPVHC